jgi:hypothetical protein
MAAAKIKVFGTTLLMLAAVFHGSQQLAGAPRQLAMGAKQTRAAQLWELSVAAKGGRDRLLNVRNLFRSYGTRQSTVVISVFPDKQWNWVDSRPSPLGLSLSMCNIPLNHNYWIAGDKPTASRRDDMDLCRQALLDEQLKFLMETHWAKPVPSDAGEEVFNGTPVDVVVAMVEGWKISYLLDKQSHLPVAYRFHGRVEPGKADVGSPLVTEFADYLDIGGIQMPTSIRYSPRTPFIKHKIEINVTYDERLFLYPPSIKAGPDAWRPKRKPQS